MNAVVSRVGVIDLGSNSLKLLVVEGPSLTLLRRATVEVRLFPAQGNLLQSQAIVQAVEAVQALAIQAGEAGARRLVVIATSALREAPNRREFIQQLRKVTSLPLTLLSGEVEARLALDGMRTDPAIKVLQDFVGFDLGGGSLEIGRLQAGQCVQALSLPLGAVRLSRLIPAQPNGVLRPADLGALREHVLVTLAARLPLGCARACPLVASGGALSNLLDLQRAAGEPDNGPIMSVLTVRNWLARLSALDLEARKAVPGIAQARADILPTALATVSALAEHTGAESLQITHHGLRHGVAQLLLSDAADLLAAAPVLS
jgi:exopolyphosphatase/guanosine-5'-triphosphate,3'-diphosphate pyrophosphatase